MCAVTSTYLVEAVEHAYSGVPVNTGVGDADAILETAGTLCRNILATSVDVGFDHDTCNVSVPCNELLADVINNFWLVIVVLLGVSICQKEDFYSMLVSSSRKKDTYGCNRP